MVDWEGFMNTLQKIESMDIKEELQEKPVDKDCPIEIKDYIESDGFCPCPVCDGEMDFVEMRKKKDNDCRCPHCGQLYKLITTIS